MVVRSGRLDRRHRRGDVRGGVRGVAHVISAVPAAASTRGGRSRSNRTRLLDHVHRRRPTEPRHQSPRQHTRAISKGLEVVRSRRRRDPCVRDRRPPGRAPPSAHAGRSVSPVTPRRLLTRRSRRGVPGRWPEPWRGARCGAAGRGAARCSPSVGPATGGRPTVGITVARPRNAVNGGRRTRGISAAKKAGSITGTANGPTARGAASGA